MGWPRSVELMPLIQTINHPTPLLQIINSLTSRLRLALPHQLYFSMTDLITWLSEEECWVRGQRDLDGWSERMPAVKRWSPFWQNGLLPYIATTTPRTINLLLQLISDSLVYVLFVPSVIFCLALTSLCCKISGKRSHYPSSRAPTQLTGTIHCVYKLLSSKTKASPEMCTNPICGQKPFTLSRPPMSNITLSDKEVGKRGEKGGGIKGELGD